MSKTFKQYYDENPEFRKRHLKKLGEKVTCECGVVSSRNNLTRHKKSKVHENRMCEMKKNRRDIINKILSELDDLIYLY